MTRRRRFGRAVIGAETSAPQATPRPAVNLFLSYRRDDSSGYVRALYDQLVQYFGDEKVFRDIDSILPGMDYMDAVDRVLATCDAVLVVIGPRWLSSSGPDGTRRLDDPEDLLRLEVEAALSGTQRVFPVLVEGAVMPRANELPPSLSRLARRQAVELSDRRWSRDVIDLIGVLNRIEDKESPSVSSAPEPQFAGSDHDLPFPHASPAGAIQPQPDAMGGSDDFEAPKSANTDQDRDAVGTSTASGTSNRPDPPELDDETKLHVERSPNTSPDGLISPKHVAGIRDTTAKEYIASSDVLPDSPLPSPYNQARGGRSVAALGSRDDLAAQVDAIRPRPKRHLHKVAIAIGGLILMASAISLFVVLKSPSQLTQLTSAARKDGWSVPHPIPGSVAGLTSISCTSSTFCAGAASIDGASFIFNGTKWTSYKIPTELVSCSAIQICVGLGGNYDQASSYNGSLWLSAGTVDWASQSTDRGGSLSCAYTFFCVATIFSGYYATFSGGSWSAPAPVGRLSAGTGIVQVSCASSTFCEAVDNAGYSRIYNGTGWSENQPVGGDLNGPSGGWSISCVSSSYCGAINVVQGWWSTFNGSRWSNSEYLNIMPDSSGLGLSSPEVGSLSCTSSDFCVAAYSNGLAYTYDGRRWSRPVLIAHPPSTDPLGVQDLSCAKDRSCTAIDGNDVIYKS